MSEYDNPYAAPKSPLEEKPPARRSPYHRALAFAFVTVIFSLVAAGIVVTLADNWFGPLIPPGRVVLAVSVAGGILFGALVAWIANRLRTRGKI
jgi:hypothetical protein